MEDFYDDADEMTSENYDTRCDLKLKNGSSICGNEDVYDFQKAINRGGLYFTLIQDAAFGVEEGFAESGDILSLCGCYLNFVMNPRMYNVNRDQDDGDYTAFNEAYVRTQDGFEKQTFSLRTWQGVKPEILLPKIFSNFKI